MILDPKTSRKIFELAKDQQEEVGVWEDDEDEDEEEAGRPSFTVPRIQEVDDEDDEDDLDRYDQDDYEEEVEEIVSGTDCCYREFWFCSREVGSRRRRS